MLLHIISKHLKPSLNCLSPFVQTVRWHAPINFIMATWPPTQSGSLTPWPGGEIIYFNLKNNNVLVWTFVSHVSDGVLLCNDSVQSNYLSPKPDVTLSDWKSSRLHLLTSVVSQQQ